MRHGLVWPRACLVAGLGLACALSACGGGGGGDGGGGGGGTTEPSLAQRVAAATATAQGSSNPCAADAPFYWELGDAQGSLASGSVNSAGNPTVYTGDTLMSIASASKWLYAAYVVQKRGGQLSDSDIKFLNFRSGYSSFATCIPGQTVDSCLAALNNGTYTAAADGVFSYDGGHMQKHASLMGLGAMDSGALANELRAQIGTDVVISYSQPQLAGGVVTTAHHYARVLRKMLGGQLLLGAQLGSHAVCTNPSTCPGQASYTPVPANESWQYSLGHWLETDPVVGDGAYSSAGAFGFYPWIDAGKRWYGIVARRSDTAGGEGYASAQCGRLIRKAWTTGVAQ